MERRKPVKDRRIRGPLSVAAVTERLRDGRLAYACAFLPVRFPPADEITDDHAREFIAAHAVSGAQSALASAERNDLLPALERMYEFQIPRTPTGKIKKEWLDRLYATVGEIAVEEAEAA